VWSTVIQIESECDDFSQELITEDDLRLNIAAKLSPKVFAAVLAGQPVIIADPLFSVRPISGTATAAPNLGSGTGWQFDASLALAHE